MADYIIHYTGNTDVAELNGLVEKMDISSFLESYDNQIFVSRGEVYKRDPEDPDSQTITFDEDGIYLKSFDNYSFTESCDATVAAKIQSQASGLTCGWTKVDVNLSAPFFVSGDTLGRTERYSINGFATDELWIEFYSQSRRILGEQRTFENKTYGYLYAKPKTGSDYCSLGNCNWLHFKYYKEIQKDVWCYNTSEDPQYPQLIYFLQSGNTNVFYSADEELSPFLQSRSFTWGGYSVVSGLSGYIMTATRDMDNVTGKTWNTTGETKTCTIYDMRYNPAQTSTTTMTAFTSNIPNDPYRIYSSSYTQGSRTLTAQVGDAQGNIKIFGNNSIGGQSGSYYNSTYGNISFTYFDGTLTPTTLTRYETYEQIGITDVYPGVALEDKHNKVFYNAGYSYTEKRWELPKFWNSGYPSPHEWKKSEMGAQFDQIFPGFDDFIGGKKPMKVHIYSHYEPGLPAEGAEYPEEGATNFMYMGTIDNKKPLKTLDGSKLYQVYSMGCEAGWLTYKNGIVYTGPQQTCG